MAATRPRGSWCRAGCQPVDRSRHSVTSENGSQTSGMKEGPLPIGLEDVIIFPLVFSVLVANTCLRAAVSILIRILDYAFPIVLQLARLPLFAARILGD